MDSDKAKQKFYWALILATIVFAYSAWLYASSYSKMIQPGSYRTFAVTGESKVTAKNDIAEFTYSVLIQGDKDIAKIKQQSDGKTGKIQEFLKAQGVDAKDIQTTSYNLQPRYQYFACNAASSVTPCRPAEIVGYTLNQTDSVKIRDLSKVDKILSGVVSAGANDVSQMNFTVDDLTTLRTQAKAEAIKNALAQAKILASAGGFGVGRIISIDENINIPTPVYSMGIGGAETMKSLAAPVSDANLNPGSNEITSNVTVRFEIE